MLQKLVLIDKTLLLINFLSLIMISTQCFFLKGLKRLDRKLEIDRDTVSLDYFLVFITLESELTVQ